MVSAPTGWSAIALDAVLTDLQPGFACGKKDAPGGVCHLRMNNIAVDGRLDLGLVRTVPPTKAKSKYDLARGDVLVCTTNSGKLVGKTALFDIEGRYAFSNHLTRLRFDESLVDNRFMAFQLWFLWQMGAFFDKCKHWVNQSTLPKVELRATRITVPPLPEQQRIVEKLQALLSRVDACRARLDKIPTILKRFRQSVLAAACSGRLTEDWREEHGERPIRTEGADLNTADDANIEIPVSWGWSRVDAVAEVQGGIQKQPKRRPEHNAYPYLRVANVLRNRLDLSEIHKMELFEGELERYRLEKDDLLVVEGNGSFSEIGRSALWNGDITDCVHQNHIIRVRATKCSPYYLNYYWNSPVGQSVVTAEAVTTAGLYSLSTKKVKEVSLPLPPLEEQREIVRRVDALFQLAGAVEQRYGAGRAAVESLTQSILAKAFRGELVPQNPADEPASVLLERIHAEKAVCSEPRKGRYAVGEHALRR